jgi:hypothetical protein
VLAKLFRKRKQLASVSRATGPIDDSLVLRELRNFSEPLGSTSVRNGDDVRDVARSQTAADRELHSFQQASGAPLFLEPVRGNGRSAVGRVSAAASLANGHVPDDKTLGCQREVIVVIHDSWPEEEQRSCRSPTVCYSCATTCDRENRPLTSLFAEETGGSSRAEFKMNVISDDT